MEVWFLLLCERDAIRMVDFTGNRTFAISIPHEAAQLYSDREGSVYLAGNKVYKLESNWKQKRCIWIGHLKEDSSVWTSFEI